MAIRTTKASVTFRFPFQLKGMSEILPAGTYDVETDEEAVEGNDRTVYHRVSTLLIVKDGRQTRAVRIDPDGLTAAEDQDQAQAAGGGVCSSN